MPIIHETNLLLEQISELEERNANLQRLEGAIQRNAALFEALLGASHDGIALTQADGQIIRVVRGILGHAPKSLNGQSVADLVYQDDRELILEAYAQLSIDPRSTVHKEVRIMTPHGGQVWVEITFRDMLDDPAVMAIVHNYRDISWRKREQNTEAELTAVLAYASAALFSVDLGGSVQVWRPECERLLGYRKDEIVCRHVQFLIPAHQVETDRASRSAVIESGRSSAPMARELVHQTGKAIQVELVLAPLVTNGAVAGVAYIFETAKA